MYISKYEVLRSLVSRVALLLSATTLVLTEHPVWAGGFIFLYIATAIFEI